MKRKINCINLRLSRDGSGLWAPVGDVKVLNSEAACVPLGVVDDTFIFAKGTQLKALRTEDFMTCQPATRLAAVQLRGEVTAVLYVADHHIIALTQAGPVRIYIAEDGFPKWSDYRLSLPAMRITARDGSVIQCTVGERKLSEAYSGGTLKTADESTIVNDLCTAYEKLCATAADAHLGLQPVLARYKLFDAGGKLLFTSPPVLLTCSDGYQCRETVRLYSADHQTVAAYTLSARTWRMSLQTDACADSAVAAAVARAEVYISPMFHPYDPSAKGSASLARLGGNDGLFAHATLPGNDVSTDTIRKALCHIDSLERLVAVIASPFGEEARTVDIVPSFGDVGADVKAIKAAQKASLASAAAVALSGQDFTATHAAMASGMIAYAAPRAVDGLSFRPEVFAADSEAGEARISAAVIMADGSCHAVDTRTLPWSFSRLSPLVLYPSASARELRLCLDGDGWSRSVVLPLTALPDGSAAVYVSDKAMPVVLGGDAVELPPDSMKAAEARSALAFASASDPWNIIATADIADGSVVALLPRTGTDQSWEFGRARFIAATRSAILSVAVDGKRRRTAVRTLIDGGVDRADALCALPGGSVLAVRDSRIVEITPTGRIRAFGDEDGYVALGYDPAMDELWALRTDGDCHIYRPSDASGYVVRNDVTVWSFMRFNGGLALGGARLWLAGHETPASKAVEMSVRLGTDSHRPSEPGAVRAVLTGSDINATFDVWDCGVDNLGKWPVLQTRIHGKVSSPLLFPLVGRRLRNPEATFSGTVSADFRVWSVESGSPRSKLT